jgi:hypothetical protein
VVKKQRKDEEQKVKVDGTVVKIKTPPPHKARPIYYCETCNMAFPSQLDLEEHRKIDHTKKVSAV